MRGDRLGPYSLLEPLGAGGMGEVWLAEDTRLGRKVAIKLLPEEFANDAERRSRFEREARAAAALNHPHIAAVYDIGSEGDKHFMVQEYLQGADLRARINAGRMPLVEALTLAAEVADGLAVAHAAGIAHRDLKPENIFVVESGHAKILDFGLAKLTERAATRDSSATQSPTVLATSAGQIMGTAGYMAPEQIAGEEVDERADLFAFGCVLYEIISGKRAFAGKNLPEVLHRLANEEAAPLTQLDPTLPVELDRISGKCLAKSVSRRYQGAADLAVDLRNLIADVESGRTTAADAAPEQVRAGAPAWAIGAAAAAGLLAGGLLYSMLGGTSAAPVPAAAGEPVHLPLRDVPGLDADTQTQMALSPDNRYLAFATESTEAQLWDLSGGAAPRAIPETFGATSPFFSPDGHWLGFVGPDNRLYRVPAEGGRPQPFTEPIGPEILAIDWRDSGPITVMTAFSDPLMQIAEVGAEPETLFGKDRELGEAGLGTGYFLPDGDQVVYSFWDDRWRVAVRSVSTGERTVLTQGFGARYVPTGHLVWSLAQQLMAATFDPVTLELGEPVQLITAIGAVPGWGRSAYDFNPRGTFVYLQAPEDRTTAILRLDADGSRSVIRTGDREFTAVAVSPDGRRLGLQLLTIDGDSQIWNYDIDRDDLVPLGQGAGWDQYPFFLGPGDELAYVSERNGGRGDIYARAANGGGTERQLTSSDPYRNGPHSSREGIIVSRIDDPETRDNDIWAWESDDLETGRPLVAGPGNDEDPHITPDSRFVAYASNRTGRFEVFVVPYPGGPDESEWKVTTEGGRAPRWTADGRQLFYLSDGMIWRVAVTGTDPFRTSVPEPFARFGGLPRGWDVAPDGSHVIAIEELAPPRPQIILDWFTELERRLPTR